MTFLKVQKLSGTHTVYRTMCFLTRASSKLSLWFIWWNSIAVHRIKFVAPFASSLLFISTPDLGKVAGVSLFRNQINCKSCRDFSLLTKVGRDPAFYSLSPLLDNYFLFCCLVVRGFPLKGKEELKEKVMQETVRCSTYKLFLLCLDIRQTTLQQKNPLGHFVICNIKWQVGCFSDKLWKFSKTGRKRCSTIHLKL